MANVVESKKACAVNPLKMSQPLGASFAFLGLDACMPVMHGSQGCTSFALVLLVWFFLERTRPGLRLRAVGENPAMVDAAGVSVPRLRYAGNARVRVDLAAGVTRLVVEDDGKLAGIITDGERRQHGGGAWNGGHLDTGLDGGGHQAVAGIRDGWHARVGDEQGFFDADALAFGGQE